MSEQGHAASALAAAAEGRQRLPHARRSGRRPAVRLLLLTAPTPPAASPAQSRGARAPPWPSAAPAPCGRSQSQRVNTSRWSSLTCCHPEGARVRPAQLRISSQEASLALLGTQFAAALGSQHHRIGERQQQRGCCHPCRPLETLQAEGVPRHLQGF